MKITNQLYRNIFSKSIQYLFIYLFIYNNPFTHFLTLYFFV